MYKIGNENVYADSITSYDENDETAIEVKVLLDAEEDEIKERFGECIPYATLCAYVTVNKYTKVVNYIQFILENEYNQTKVVSSPISFEEQECLRKIAVDEIRRDYMSKQ